MKCQRESCQSEFKPDRKTSKYCSRSCAAKVNNSRHPKRAAKALSQCVDCGATVSSRRTRRCNGCHLLCIKYKSAERVQQWLDGSWSGGGAYILSDTVRRYLLEKSDYKCQACSFSAFHPIDGKSILEINHVNGDGTDHRPENLQVLCPNCHALTPTYRGRNRGNGRPWSYHRRAPD